MSHNDIIVGQCYLHKDNKSTVSVTDIIHLQHDIIIIVDKKIDNDENMYYLKDEFLDYYERDIYSELENILCNN